jgi:hypothetical protein
MLKIHERDHAADHRQATPRMAAQLLAAFRPTLLKVKSTPSRSALIWGAHPAQTIRPQRRLSIFCYRAVEVLP